MSENVVPLNVLHSFIEVPRRGVCAVDDDQLLSRFIERCQKQQPEQVLEELAHWFGEAIVARLAMLIQEARRAALNMDPMTGVLQGEDEPEGLILPEEGGPIWRGYRDALLSRGWPERVVSSINATSRGIVARLESPGRESFDRRGLVLGHVQSGKTAGFMGVIAHAVDAGYRLVIVMTGMHNTLRSQTQRRLEAELVGPTRNRWYLCTTIEEDFTPNNHGNLGTLISNDVVILCVVKKNTHILANLRSWLGGSGEEVIGRCPALIIDDEADQASINTAGQEEERSAINNHIVELISMLNRSAFVAYTATPFANVLVDPADRSDLYPRDFIISMPQPAGYMGAAQIFGREALDDDELDADAASLDGLDMIRHVPDEDFALLSTRRYAEVHTFEPTMTESLEEALRWFIASCAIRLSRGQVRHHMSMLVHTTLLTNIHAKQARMIREWLDAQRQHHKQLVAALRPLVERECDAVPAESMGEPAVDVEAALACVRDVLEAVEVIVDNSASLQTLSFEAERSIQIAVGGNTLSRGLTIEGLCVSYFLRAASAYDTLLQMGRWFGYRHGYGDLTRVYTTAELAQAFEHLATVEEEVRRDILRYTRDSCTPLEFGVRIRTHPQIAITSRLKMGKPVPCIVSYADRMVQTTVFSHKNAAWLRSNQEAAATLLSDARAQHGEAELVWDRHHLFRGVDVSSVERFLKAYHIHPLHDSLRRDMLLGYISGQLGKGRLKHWNVAVISRTSGGDLRRWGGFDAIGEIGLLRRSQLESSSTHDTANLGVITSAQDRAVDLGLDRATLSRMRSEELRTLIHSRRFPDPGEAADPQTGAHMPLLLLYPIASDSPATTKRRRTLDAQDELIGLALVFPDTPDRSGYRYMTVDLSQVAAEECS